MVEKELVRDSNSLRDNFLALINTKDIMNKVEILMNFDLVFLYDGNYKVGNSDHFIIEACEYVESFLKFSPKAEVILNIDADHLDYFKTFSNIVKSFQMYVKKLKSGNVLVLNKDDENVYKKAIEYFDNLLEEYRKIYFDKEV